MAPNTTTWYDSHCHFDFTEFDGERDRLIQSLQTAHCAGLVVPATTAQHWARLLQLQQSHPGFIHIALGLHPFFMAQHQASHLQALAYQLEHHTEGVVAVGEIGLDFMQARDADQQKQQIELFRQQLVIAKQYGLPVILHSRKSHDDVAKLLRQLRFDQGGIVHGFSGSLQQAHAYADLGFVVGLGGALTHERARAMHKLVSALPDEHFVLETDAPDMRPAFALSAPNSPLNLPRIADHIARLRNLSVEQLYQTTTQNLHRVLPRLLAM